MCQYKGQDAQGEEYTIVFACSSSFFHEKINSLERLIPHQPYAHYQHAELASNVHSLFFIDSVNAVHYLQAVYYTAQDFLFGQPLEDERH